LFNIETKQFALFMNHQNPKETRKDRSGTCLEQIKDVSSCFGKSKNEKKLILYHFRSDEKRIEVVQESKKQNEQRTIINFYF